ncbi:unnamed protein product [Pieris brassicae]|uniref:Uncharacterized protein n=1 Tax=Pieris brassicae TaxID=7116 RepID=A0A9P0TBQ3_PIEBR|nr:unnamed protein product [Pieris brassicae]
MNQNISAIKLQTPLTPQLRLCEKSIRPRLKKKPTNKHANMHVTCCKFEKDSTSANQTPASAHVAPQLAVERGAKGRLTISPLNTTERRKAPH